MTDKIPGGGQLNSSKNRSSKLYSKSLTLLVASGKFGKQGTIAADIARTLNMEKSHVSYYITKAKILGYLKEVTRDVFAILN